MSALSPTAGAPVGRIGGLSGALAARWQKLAVRERRAVAVAGAVLAAGALWLIGVEPAWRTMREAPTQIELLDLQLQQMRALAAEAVSLRAATPVSASQAVAALEAATRRMGPSGKLTVLGDRATLRLVAVDPQALQQWLELARSAARARPIEAQLTRAPNGYSGLLVVNLGAGR